jgi:hypothetical protein
MFQPIKYLGHIHYACPISGMTDKNNRFQDKDEYWDCIQLNVQCIFHFPMIFTQFAGMLIKHFKKWLCLIVLSNIKMLQIKANFATKFSLQGAS